MNGLRQSVEVQREPSSSADTAGRIGIVVAIRSAVEIAALMDKTPLIGMDREYWICWPRAFA